MLCYGWVGNLEKMISIAVYVSVVEQCIVGFSASKKGSESDSALC